MKPSVRDAVFLACLFVGIPTTIFSATPPDTAQASLQAKAIGLYRDGRLDEALVLYERLSRMRPDDTVILKNLMWIQWKTGDVQATADTAAHVAELLPEDEETWNLLGQASEAAGRWKEAIRAYRKLLALEPERNDVCLALARLYLNIKDDDAAISLLQRVVIRSPGSTEAFAALGQIEFYKGDFDSSLKNWRRALAADPSNIHYQVGEAKALYYSGQPDAAITHMKQTLAADPEARDVSDFLIDDALSHGDLTYARDLLTSRLTDFQSGDELRIFQLADVLRAHNEWDQSIVVLKRYLNINNTNGQALLGLGDSLFHVHRTTEAAVYYQQVLKNNPWPMRAYIGLADVQIELNKPREAVHMMEEARRLDPTNPTLVLRQAEYLYDAKDEEASRKLLMSWVHDQSQPVLPVLLYHGLTPLVRDPMLAYSIHMTTAAFENQMKAIHDAGYTAVTVQQVYDWYKNQTPLPKKPILITFDDARADSFRYADPILEKYGLRATMCVPTHDVDLNLAGNASWDDIKRYAGTGRWEIQAHGDLAHNYIQIDSEGRRGIFLANKAWLPKENRFETVPEWRDRIDSDHQRVIQKIHDHVGVTPVALAWPEGNFGQDSMPNSPEAATLNLKLVRDHFALAFQESEYGLNLHSRDPILLTRLQPTQRMSGDDLVRLFRNNSPILLAHRMLLEHAVWENRTSEAEAWLTALREDGAENSLLLIEEARLKEASGEPEAAIALAHQALALDNSTENRLFLNELLHPRNHGWTAGGTYEKDNQGRESFVFEQSLDVAKTGPVLWSLLQQYGRYLESGAVSVTDNGGGASALWTLPRHNQLQLRASGHAYSSPVDNTYSVLGSWDAQWPQGWTTRLEGARLPYDTALALNSNIYDRYGAATVQWKDVDTWRAELSGAAHDLSDTNKRYSGYGEVARKTGWAPLSAILYSSFDQMEFVSPDYYSPQHLQTYEGGLELQHTWPQVVSVRLRYLAGTGKEDPTDWQFVQDASISASFPVKRVSFDPTCSFYDTPTYRLQTYLLNVSYSF